MQHVPTAFEIPIKTQIKPLTPSPPSPSPLRGARGAKSKNKGNSEAERHRTGLPPRISSPEGATHSIVCRPSKACLFNGLPTVAYQPRLGMYRPLRPKCTASKSVTEGPFSLPLAYAAGCDKSNKAALRHASDCGLGSVRENSGGCRFTNGYWLASTDTLSI